MSSDFSVEQKQYLDGFLSGVQAVRSGVGKAAAPADVQGPDSSHIAAQDRTVAEGKKLCDQEKWKRAEHPFDAYGRLKEQALTGQYPKPDDNFRWRYHGLFYVAPAENSFMCRMRLANGILSAWQLEGVAAVAQELGGGYAHVTTRANLQIREITAENAAEVVERLCDLGITSKGSGADNIRNVTGSATAGIDQYELLDTRPYARAWHHHILNDRSLIGLPRKFNVAFDGAGSIATLEDTNDIGFQAVEVTGGIEPGIYFRLALGGISGHKDLARDTGVVLNPNEAVAVADAVIRVFTENADRTNRAKARLKYVLDAWGFERFLKAVEDKLGRPLVRVDARHIAPRMVPDRSAHIGVHAQKQTGLSWIGVWTPLGRMSVDDMRNVAHIAKRYGDGDIRLTVWQNLILSGVADADVAQVRAELTKAGLAVDVSAVRAGLVACTGSQGCKFAASDTKSDALKIAQFVEQHVALDQPINIHVTGCHNSCAQHYIGDIGLIGAKVTINEDGDQVDGYHIHIGGGFAEQGAIGRLMFENVRAVDAPEVIGNLLRAYLAHRENNENFWSFTKRHDVEQIKSLCQKVLS